MKLFLSIFLFAGLAKQCSKIDEFAKLDAAPHPNYVHQMEITLANDLNSDDSATAKWADELIRDFESDFRKYAPKKDIARKLSHYTPGTAVKVVGGNWCSDTKRELPRLCKVLYYMGVPVDSFHYYRVDKDKKPVENDFATTWTKSAIPDIIVYRYGKEMGHIREVTRVSMEADLLEILK